MIRLITFKLSFQLRSFPLLLKGRKLNRRQFKMAYLWPNMITSMRLTCYKIMCMCYMQLELVGWPIDSKH